MECTGAGVGELPGLFGRGAFRAQFDSGAIGVVRLDDPGDIQLRTRRDSAAAFT